MRKNVLITGASSGLGAGMDTHVGTADAGRDRPAEVSAEPASSRDAAAGKPLLTRSRPAPAASERREAEVQAHDMRRRVETDVRTALISVASAREEVAAAQARLVLAEQDVSQARERFRQRAGAGRRRRDGLGPRGGRAQRPGRPGARHRRWRW